VIEQDHLTAKQQDYAVFLPAISSFYASYIGRQRSTEYVEKTRMPAGIPDMEMLNWLNAQQGLFPYRWSLYSAGHANLDLAKPDPSEDMVRNRDPNTIVLGDSGGFQIAKGVWEGDWRAGSGCARAQRHRETALKWLDGIADYAMVLDIPSFVINEKNGYKSCIRTLEEAADATRYNNEYFMANRLGVANGGTRFLNVLQGGNHTHADEWYEMMKGYSDPALYPDRHFNGWAMGGQNMCDVHLILRRLVALRHDNLLREGVHDWMHFLGTSKLEWALLLTDLQRAIRKYVNPRFTISFDCASPFLATANGQVYHHLDMPDRGKWCYRMSPIADDKKYANDTRPYGQAALADGLIGHFDESPISQRLKMNDICVYGAGVRKAGIADADFDFMNPDHYDVLPDLNKNGKWGRTSWDSFSYALLMGHNVWMHIEAVQRANREYDAGRIPAMMWNQGEDGEGDHARFRDIVDAIFATPDRAESEAIIQHYDRYWMDIVGTRGFKGKKTRNSTTKFNELFSFEEEADPTADDDDLDPTPLDALDQAVPHG
jgi:hypothetical protein